MSSETTAMITGALIGSGFAIVGIVLGEVLKRFFSLQEGAMTLIGTAVFILLVSLYNYLPEAFATGFVAGTLLITLLWWVLRNRVKQKRT